MRRVPRPSWYCLRPIDNRQSQDFSKLRLHQLTVKGIFLSTLIPTAPRGGMFRRKQRWSAVVNCGPSGRGGDLLAEF